MSAADLAAVVVVIVATVAAAAVAVLCWQVRLTVRHLRRRVDTLDELARSLTEELEALSGSARRSLLRAEDQLDRSGQVVDAIEGASRFTYRTVAQPVIKVASVASGVRRGAGRLRHGTPGEAPARAGPEGVDPAVRRARGDR